MTDQNIFEIAHIDIGHNNAKDFEAAVAKARPLFQRAKGCVSMRLIRQLETPSQYILLVGWKTLDNHMVDFRESQDFQSWRALVGGFFHTKPTVYHTQSVTEIF
ncbi:MAG: antibiotic biosynthesis monooxygenase [Robiginitomaculum sp.]|nr:MAG: antibiotic biosynthesis monooxygenase [Robiginitomaculum sp.]